MGVQVELKKVLLSNGETLTYREREGGEKKVLLIHGNMTSSKHWDLVIENMEASFKIYAVDLRGFGGSTYHTPIQSIKDFSEDVRLFVEAIQLTDFSIVGWSTGGAIGMQFVADYPGVCEKLVLLASASTRGYPFYGVTEDGQVDLNNRLQTYEDVKNDSKTLAIQGAYDTQNRELLKATWNALIYTKNQPSEELYEEYVDDMLTQRNLAEVYHALNTFNISSVNNGLTEGENQAKDIIIPTLVLRGERDLVVVKHMAEEIMQDLGENARFIELKDCGHSPLVDDLEQLLQEITDFLS
ncbi:intracellular short-chain-length polyhydroxyalkanoate depolymerase [Robertmurraya kyonggiensis]|uniref:Alpha/beta hydrolase n=1 Tax=Robertmurraya kyonggiensis TaxID=1037680 RepID=A0A4U1DFB2_9BACI|nr:alpha/beta hydrolase [Robertmurraya kyonggiensis]TKC20097.1 alpha/beta hydrolase [Robertmurraya kyonggiensis]